MAKLSKKQKGAKEIIERGKRYGLGEAIDLLKKSGTAKFDESVDLAIKLGVDPRKADQMIRGACALPHGTGKSVRVLVVAKGEKLTEAKDAGADYYGGEDMIEKIKGGWLDFDRMVATPDMMAQVGKVGKILGPRGLMPNPKVGTVTTEVAKVVAGIKAGQVEFRVDKAGILHVPVGRMSFENSKIEENVTVLVGTVKRMRPSSTKGTYMKGITLNPTMGPGVALDPVNFG